MAEYNNVLVGRGAGDTMTTEVGSIVIGNGAMAKCDKCLVIGDDVVADGDNKTRVGGFLFGQSIPIDVAEMILRHPQQMRWLLRTLMSELRKYGWEIGQK